MDKNRKTLLFVLGIVAMMIGVAFASVPLYNLFCKVTGFGGTTQISAAAPAKDKILDREITIHFNGSTNRNLNWQFEPEIRKINLRIGEQGLINFKGKNITARPSTGTAVYNVTPLKAGKYFHKTQCFCFDAQKLEPGQEMNFPVVFYVDPSIAQDRNMDDLKTISLSYSFFKSDSQELENAMEEYYDTE